VLNQSLQDWELIVVDDNSADDTSQIVASFDDPRIRYVRNDPNLRLPRALNRGFSMARGEYLTWTSDDNFYADTALERMLKRLQQGGCDLVYADYYLFSATDAGGRPTDTKVDRLPDDVRLDKGNHIGACFMYTRRAYEAVGDYDPELFLVEDYDYFIRIAKHFPLCHIAEPLYYFRRDDATLYCSRFAEVKASDVLVRYKNELLDEQQLLATVVRLIARNPAGLRNPVLRWVHRAVTRISFRLTQWHDTMTKQYLTRSLRRPITSILTEYRAGGATFGESRDALRELLQRFGALEYRA
jgi:glycosyltransferase involved in cell wall biosynthesis